MRHVGGNRSSDLDATVGNEVEVVGDGAYITSCTCIDKFYELVDLDALQHGPSTILGSKPCRMLQHSLRNKVGVIRIIH